MSNNMKKDAEGMSRRSFLKASMLGVGLSALPAMGMVLPACAENETPEQAAQRVTGELPIPEAAAPEKTEYTCDVLVIGGGFAGLNAAAAAADAGQKVVMIDKGHPGYSGLSPWPSSHRWADPEMGDDLDALRTCINHGSEYIGNMDWYEVWLKESKGTYERLRDWGILDQYDRATETGYYEKNDFAGYREAYAEHDRRTKFEAVLKAKNIEYADYTMVTNVIVENNRVCGAVGFHVPSGAIITCSAKAVIMCMGGGCYKPTGFPTGGDTFDGEYIAYNLGLPIAGKEFDDFHMTLSWAPGNAFLNNNWTYLDNCWLCGGDITPDTAISYATSKAKVMVLDRVTKAMNGLALNDGSSMEDMSTQSITRRGGSESDNPNEVRTGKNNDTMFKGDIYGAAVGFGAHLTNGVFCGLDDLEGKTSIEGLWVAGDGMNACGPTGSAYPCGVGFTSNFVSIQGNRAGAAAAAYAAGAELTPISQERIDEETATIQAPLSVTSGFDPNWARDQLVNIMSPYWVYITKSEETLKAALTQVEVLRDKVMPKLQAANYHDVRLCLEMRHKILNAELSLRASLERRETRGVHYRTDYPYRDDENFLCIITLQKNAEGGVDVARVPVKDSWKGDLTADYKTRYTYYFPNELETLGLPAEEASSGWGK